jgi:gamma-glutamylcyclotransferase (GGCT)/AIG2-like uncharacterized protein YtfP
MEKRMSKRNIFVYGTLKRGNYNNYILTHSNKCDGKFIKEATIPASTGLAMVDFGGFPAVYISEEPTDIIGEIWEIDWEEGGPWLDALENYPRMYNRGITEIAGMDCIVYFMHHNYDSQPKIKEWTQ